jgi:hypothetical protein
VGTTVLEGEGGIVNVQAAYYCSSALIRNRQRTGEPVPDWLRQHHAQLDAEIRGLSRTRHHDDEIDCDLGESNQIGAREAAVLLGWSIRKVQRRKEDQGGRLVGGGLIFDRSAILESRPK